MEKPLTFVIAFGVIALLIWDALTVTDRVASQLREKGYTVHEVEPRWSTVGSPYYFLGKGQRLFRCETDKGVIWYRTGFGGEGLFDDGSNAF